MLRKNLISIASIFMVPIILQGHLVNEEITASTFFGGLHNWFDKANQMAFALEEESMHMDLVINTSTLKIHDLNNNKHPDTGELSTVLGKLYNADTKKEQGSYRALFVWGALDNSTGQAPVSLGTQVFDFKDNGTLVVIGDIVTDSRNGSGPGISVPIGAAIAGGTGDYIGISGSAIVTERFYDPGKALYLDVVLDMIRPFVTQE